MGNAFRSSHFTLKHRLIARASLFLDGFVYTQRRGLARGMRRRGGLGFVPELLSREDSPELRFLRELRLHGQVVYDVGAFEGLMTLFFSRTARRVVTYEPNADSCARIEENLRLNRVENVTLRPLGAGEREEGSTLVYDPLMPGAASADGHIGEYIRGSGGPVQTTSIRVVRLDDDVRENDLPDPDFVKLDVEGMELSALRGMEEILARSRPALYIEMHGATDSDKRERAEAIIEFLVRAGYDETLHVESGKSINLDNADGAARGHLYCRSRG